MHLSHCHVILLKFKFRAQSHIKNTKGIIYFQGSDKFFLVNFDFTCNSINFIIFALLREITVNRNQKPRYLNRFQFRLCHGLRVVYLCSRRDHLPLFPHYPLDRPLPRCQHRHYSRVASVEIPVANNFAIGDTLCAPKNN